MGGYTLIVDDEPVMAQLLDAILSAIDITTRIASDGEEALACIQGDPPDLILLDLMMPRMSGFEVLAQLRNNPATSRIPVVVISAYANHEDTRLAGAARILRKGNFSVREIREIVTPLLGGSPK